MKTKILFLFLAVLTSTFLYSQEKNDEDVYITKSGSKYHHAGCSYLKGGGIKKKLSEVEGSYSPCSRCFGSGNNRSPSSESSGGESMRELFKETPSSSEPSKTSESKSNPSNNDAQSGTTRSGQPIYTGPRGGQYHYSKSGKKVYERKK